MSKDTSFCDYVVNDLLIGVSGISSKAMFGGHGVYKDEKIFAIIVDGELYLKANNETKKFFATHNSHQFTYLKKNGKTYAMNYWFVPEETFEDREKFVKWVDVAVGV